jgi:hypothetical protein
MTPCVACTMDCSQVRCKSGRTAMHSMTSASQRSATAARTTASCSRMFGPPRRRMRVSVPSTWTSAAALPVVLATTRRPPPRSPAPINRATDDLPRVPLT